MEMHKTSKKRKFSVLEIVAITLQIQLNKVLFGSQKSGIKGVERMLYGKKSQANSVAVVN